MDRWRERLLEFVEGKWSLGEERFNGTFVNNKFNTGVYINSNGEKYEGTFSENLKLNGKGSYYDTKGNKYEGNFKDGVKILFLKTSSEGLKKSVLL